MMPLAIRADANAEIGAGHVVRSLALAEAWRRAGGCDITWFAVEPPPRLRSAATGRGVAIRAAASPPVAWASLLDWVHAHPSGWVVFDSYALGLDDQRAIVAAGARLLVVDDCATSPEIVCDVLLNQNIHADRLPYRTPSGTRRLTGPTYALLRSEFLEEPPARDFGAPSARMLVTFGGADAHDQARRVERLLPSLTPPLEVRIVAGQAHPHSGFTTIGRLRVDWQNGTDDMAGLLRWADLAVCASGSTCWEVARLGVPAIALIVSSNQERIAAGLDEAGVIRNAGWYDRIGDDELGQAIEQLRHDPVRAAMSRRGRDLVDGRGADRVAAVMHQIEREAAPCA
jgi:UDP-2,4-diacetamido-2,4,6-trideoxy-beta-L-altropyranose hydrolase